MTGAVVWLTGLPASGKSTLAGDLAARLRDARTPVVVLDGDEVRAALVPPPGYHEEARDAFYRTLANVAALVARQGLIVLVAATAHRRRWRELARSLAPCFVEVHVATTLEECRRRDPRGVYCRGDTTEVPGLGVAYEAPEAPDVTASAGDESTAVDRVLAVLGVSELARHCVGDDCHRVTKVSPV